MLKPKLEAMPRFETEAEELAFRSGHDTRDYVDWSKARRVVLPEWRPATTSISMRLPVTLTALKRLAFEQDVGFWSLMKAYLAERAAPDHVGSDQAGGRSHPLARARQSARLV